MPLTGEVEPGTEDWARKQAERYERTNGEKGGTTGGKPVIVLTTLGARTGRLRKTVLMRVEHDGTYAAVASLGGAPTNPDWYYNLLANPLAELQDRDVRRDYRAREISGDEKAVWWERAVAVWPDYARYQRRTKREIPVVLLEPVTD
jgi:deazaflavin-dependent oxidoreductase (nitroreductase family)